MATSFLKHWKKILFLLILFLPIWMLLIWFFWPKQKLEIAIIDKTVLTKQGQEHVSLNWILNQEKFVKSNNKLYNRSKDYFGFFPLENEKFELKGLERFSNAKLNELSQDADVAYITDAYGIYRNEWYKHFDEKERSGIVYGGMSENDVDFLQLMQQNHKLIIAEFNCLGSPTSTSVRNEFEKSFGVKWSGWIGRYFDLLDTAINKEIPKWMIKNYLNQHNQQWPFTKSGIVFVRNDDRIEILSSPEHLNIDKPFIYSTKEGINYYGLTEKIKYTYWFEINSIDTSFNHSLAHFKIDANKSGMDSLRSWNIPSTFPAVNVHWNNDYKFYYLSGDFCDNPIGITTSYFKGIKYFSWLLYNRKDSEERESFFWKFYNPLLTRVLKDYYYTLHR